MKQIFLRLLLIAGGLVFCIALLEVPLQVTGAVHAVLKSHRNRLPADGKKLYRILCLGDSMTDNQYPWHLEEVLNGRNPGASFKVIDRGRSGTTTDRILADLPSYLDEYRPDAVVIMMGITERRDDLIVIERRPGAWYTGLRTYKLAHMLRSRLINAWDEGSRKDNAGEPTGGVSGYAEAEEKYRALIRKEPRNGQAYTALGETYLAEKKYREAEETFRDAMRVCRGNEAYLGLGETYEKEKKYREAEGLLRKAMAMDPADDRVYRGLGDVYLREKRYGEAEAMYRKAVAMHTKDDGVYIELGNMLYLQQRYGEAEEIYRNAIEMRPGNGRACEMLSILYRKQRRYAEAAEVFARGSRERRKMGGGALPLDGPRYGIKIIQGEGSDTSEHYGPKTRYSYRRLKEIVLDRKIMLVCVEYPTRRAQPLMDMLGRREGMVFVDNEQSFKDGAARDGYDAYFVDRFAGEFGHCTYTGNRLLAENIADAIQGCLPARMKVPPFPASDDRSGS